MNDLTVEKIPTGREPAFRWWWTLFNVSEDAQIVCRADGTVQHINPKAAQMFKLKLDLGRRRFFHFKILPLPANQKLERLLKNPARRALRRFFLRSFFLTMRPVR